MLKRILYLLSIIIVLPINILAQSNNYEKIEKTTQEISDNVMSPFCPGLTLSSCPSPQAKELKLEIQSWLTQGYSKEAAINKLKISYGDKITGLPKTSSFFGIILSFMPYIFFLLGIVLLLYTLKKMKKA